MKLRLTDVAMLLKLFAGTMFSATISIDDLPSARTVIRFADIGHVIAKMQVSTAILESDNFDLHSDGTTKGGKKFVNNQVTLDNGQSLSCGFTIVGQENATTLVDITVNLLEELTIVYEDDIAQRHVLFLEMLQRLTGLMTDRAAVMKAFGREMSGARKTLLQCDDDLAFLHCNAHFLLGLSSAVEKTLKTEETRVIGRQKCAKFCSQKQEQATLRCIREACACLGPRGDERYGCREQWLAFCMLNETTSEITSFKANRFNNLFQASAAILFHRAEIQDFLTNSMAGLNWKQEGILEDLRCDTLDDQLVALGLVFFRLTGPYWQLLGKNISYLDFYTYVIMMQQFLQRWATSPTDAFAVDFEPLFGISTESNPVFLSLLQISQERKERVQVVVQALSSAFLNVVNNQLSEFLPGGKYFAVQDEVLRDRLKSSKLTNLIGEQCFGDLDFSIFKRRNSSCHHHSTVNIIKRNRTFSKWFSSLPHDDQAATLSRASEKAQYLREKHRQAEKSAMKQRQEVLLQVRQKKEATAEKRRQKIQAIIDGMKPHHGPCQTPAEVDNLLQSYNTLTLQQKALKSEVMYHKLVLKVKSPLLRASARMPLLQDNLKAYLQNASGTSTLDQRDDRDDTESDESRSESDMEDDATELDSVTVQPFTFTFENCPCGTSILVGYEEDYYVGEVEEVIRKDVARINFMEKCNLKPNTFRWPSRPDTAEVHEKFVIASALPLASANGRIWTLQNGHIYKQKYLAFKSAFFY